MKSMVMALCVAATFVFSIALPAFAGEKLVVYTSMKESLIGELRDGFINQYLFKRYW